MNRFLKIDRHKDRKKNILISKKHVQDDISMNVKDDLNGLLKQMEHARNRDATKYPSIKDKPSVTIKSYTDDGTPRRIGQRDIKKVSSSSQNRNHKDSTFTNEKDGLRDFLKQMERTRNREAAKYSSMKDKTFTAPKKYADGGSPRRISIRDIKKINDSSPTYRDYEEDNAFTNENDIYNNVTANIDEQNIYKNILANLDDEDIRELEELEDGSSIYEIGKSEEEEVNEPESFYGNLAGTVLKDSALKKLSVYLLEAIDKDIEASQGWMDVLKRVKGYLGFEIEELKNSPFKEATRTYDTTFANILLKYYAHTRSEFLPNTGPVGYIIPNNPSEELDEKGTRVRDFLNNYLVRVDKPYYPDFERFLLHLGFNGSSCRKVYFDKFLKRPISRFITAEDFIIDADCNSISDSQRITHVLHLSKRDILLNQQSGIYRNVDLPYLKSSENNEDVLKKESDKDNVNLSVYEKRSLFPIYECHVYLNLDDFNDSNNFDEKSIPLPFIVIIDPNSKEILSVCRNWREEDPNQERINYFVLYNLLAGFGIRGLGFAQMLGSNAISLTTILRELIDAGKFQNLPGGLRKKGSSKQQQNDLIIGPGEFVEVDTYAEDLDKCFMPLPYSGPSQALSSERMNIINQTKELGATAELGMLDSREAISPATLIMALEKNNKIQNVISESIHCSFNQELQLIYDMFKRTMDNDFSEYVNGHEVTIDDFVEEIEIIPVSNPSTNSTIHKLVRSQAMLETAMMAPDIHNQYEVFKYTYKAQGLAESEIDKILPNPNIPEEQTEEVLPLDPVSENLNILAGKPVKAAKWQAHDAHILSHGLFIEANSDKPEVQSEGMAHIKEHQALKYLAQMEQILGYELPPLEEILNPEVQNQIALSIAENLNETMSENEAPSPIDPNELLMADIRQKEQQAMIQREIANLKAETDVFKAQLEFEKQKAKIESEEDIAILKGEIELMKQEMQNSKMANV